MKNKLLRLRPILPALLHLAALAARAAVPVERIADVDRPAARPLAVAEGEPVRLAARLMRGGAPYAPGLSSPAAEPEPEPEPEP